MRLHRLSVRARKERHRLLDERQARAYLGYTIRPDHPWLRPHNERRPRLSKAEGARREQEFEGVSESTG